jgi:bisphosphoglycerate-dependent phosphoglycerate mutase
MVKVSRVIEAKNVSHVYIGWSNDLKLTVEGGEVIISLDESSLRAIAKVVNNKITEQDEEKVEAAAEAAAAVVLAEKENDE